MAVVTAGRATAAPFAPSLPTGEDKKRLSLAISCAPWMAEPAIGWTTPPCGSAGARSGATSRSRWSAASSSRCSGANGVGQVDAAARCCSALLPLAARQRAVLGARARRGERRRSATCRSGARSTRDARSAASTSCGSGSTATAGGCRCRSRSAARARARATRARVARGDRAGRRERLRRPPDRRALRRRAAAAADRAGARAPPAAAAARRAAGQPRPAQPGRGRGARRSASAASRASRSLLVAHDVNPLLGYLDRVVYLAGGRAVAGRSRRSSRAETLSALYGVPIEVLRASDGRLVVVGQPEAPAHHHDRHEHAALTPDAATLSREPRRWNVRATSRRSLEYHFMVNALRGRDVVAVMAGVVGWLMVLRRQTFAGHTLAMMAFPGAAAAALAGVPVALGYFVVLRRRRARDRAARRRARRDRGARSRPAIGAVQALGARARLPVREPLRRRARRPREPAVRRPARRLRRRRCSLLVVVAVGALAVLASLGAAAAVRSVDPTSPRARRARARARRWPSCSLLGLAVAATSQITGPLLVFALLVIPAATRAGAHRAAAARAWRCGRARARWSPGWGSALAYFSVYPAASSSRRSRSRLRARARSLGAALAGAARRDAAAVGRG